MIECGSIELNVALVVGTITSDEEILRPRPRGEALRGKLKLSNDGYTQREWDRTVGWGKVPDKYNRVSNTDKNAENTQRRKIRLEKHSKYLVKKYNIR